MNHPGIKVLGESCLRQVATPVSVLDNGFYDLIFLMTKTMHEAQGVGIAANQVGDNRAIFILATPEAFNEVFLNPEILEKSEPIDFFEEGCLSVPGVTAQNKARFNKVKLKYTDYKTMQSVEKEYQGLTAVAIQHEVDHLNGKLYIDHLGPVAKSLTLGKYNKLLKSFNKEGN